MATMQIRVIDQLHPGIDLKTQSQNVPVYLLGRCQEFFNYDFFMFYANIKMLYANVLFKSIFSKL
jgi:hypothetical protein